MNTAILCLGSNLKANSSQEFGITYSADAILAESIERLKAFGCKAVESSGEFDSNDYYHNEVISIDTDLGYDELVSASKQIEKDLGRSPEMKKIGVVPIDIDVVIFNGEVKRKNDFDAFYFKMGYDKLTHK